METNAKQNNHPEWLIFLGVFLFLLGLIVALFMPIFANKRMGLSAHLEGIMNGMFLIILGLIWSKLLLSEKWLRTTFWLTIYGSFANFVAVTIGAITGAGKMMSLAGGKEGSTLIEGIISTLLISLTLAMILVCVIVLFGLYSLIIRPLQIKK